jgi:hypothetical protein
MFLHFLPALILIDNLAHSAVVENALSLIVRVLPVQARFDVTAKIFLITEYWQHKIVRKVVTLQSKPSGINHVFQIGKIILQEETYQSQEFYLRFTAQALDEKDRPIPGWAKEFEAYLSSLDNEAFVGLNFFSQDELEDMKLVIQFGGSSFFEESNYYFSASNLRRLNSEISWPMPLPPTDRRNPSGKGLGKSAKVWENR